MELLEERRGFIHADHAPGGSDKLRQVQRGVPGPAADVQDGLARLYARTLPQLVRGRGPQAVLKP